LQTHNVNRCGRSRHLARKLSLRRKRSSPNVFEMAATETITSIILIKLIRVSLGTVRHPRRFKIVVIDIQITLKQMLRDFIEIGRAVQQDCRDRARVTASTRRFTLSLHDALPISRKLSLRRKRSSPNVFEMAATETITSIILIKLIRVSLGTVRHPRRFKIVVIDIQITLKQMLRDFIGIRVNRAKKSGMVNITSSVNSRERSGINTILHELNPLFTINVTMRDIKSKNVYSRVNSKATTQWRKTESANGV